MRKWRPGTFRLGILLIVCGILLMRPASASAAGTEIITPTNMEEFTDAVFTMIEKNAPVNSSDTATDDTFCNKRLIVKSVSTSIDFTKYDPITMIQGNGITILQFATGEETESAMKEIRKLRDVEYAEPDVNLEAEAAADGSAGAGPYSWGVSVIEADKFAAELAPQSKTEIKVAVVDSGVSNHTFLNGRLLPGFDYIDNDNDPMDLFGHGTHVAGIVADCTPNLNVKIIPVRVLDAKGSGMSLTTGMGVIYAVDQGADVINLSLSGRHTKFLDDSISYAIQKGAVVVAAAGNKAQNTAGYCPAHIRDAIVVGAVNTTLNVPTFSNTGESVDVVAPGVNINSTIPGDEFQKKSGTSMAAPHVAALAAMYKLQDQSRSPEEIQRLIRDNARDLGPEGWDSSYGCGLAEAYKTFSPTQITLDLKSFSIQVGKSRTLKASLSPDDASRRLTWKSSNQNATVTEDGTVTGKKTGKATITVTTDNGLSASCKVTVTKKKTSSAAKAPKQPTKVKLNKTKLSIKAGSSEKLKATVSPSGAVKKLTWKSSKPSVATVDNGTVTARTVGSTTITVTTGNGKKATCTVTVKEKPMSSSKALKNYKSFLAQNTRYQYFRVCYINKNSVPDMVAAVAPHSYNARYFIDGKEAVYPAMEASLGGDLDEPDGSDFELDSGFVYYYYPKKNLVMYRSPINDTVWEEYSTFEICVKGKKYNHSQTEFLTRVLDPADDSPFCLHYYLSVSSTPDALVYDELLDQWILEERISETDFQSLISKKTGSTKLTELTFVKNTSKNRTKYLKK